MSPFNVVELAKRQGWEPDQVRAILEQYQIPPKSSNRTHEQWQQLEHLLLRTPNKSVHEGVASDPKVPSVGDRVQLKHISQLQYTLLEMFPVFTGLEGGQSTHESWARLLDDAGHIAHWKLIQLEAA